MAIDFRQLHDGTLAAPRRGKPPATPEGYERDPGDAFLFYPKLRPCEYRQLQIDTKGCCDPRERLYCKFHKKYILRINCMHCAQVVVIKQKPKPLDGQPLYQMLYTDLKLHYGDADMNRCPGIRYLPKYYRWLVSPIIDLGCGRGQVVKKLRQDGFDADGIDWIDLQNGMMVGDITQSINMIKYNTAICIDVVEHIDDEGLMGLLKNMQKVKHQVITVFCGPSKEREYTTELHINIKTKEQWTQFLSRYLHFERVIALSKKRFLYFFRSYNA